MSQPQLPRELDEAILEFQNYIFGKRLDFNYAELERQVWD